jgi:excisionase family DNA binding protein
MKLSEREVPRIGDYITITEAADILAVTRQHIYKLAAGGEFSTVRRVGREDRPLFLISEAEVNTILNDADKFRQMFPRTATARKQHILQKVS